jgi:hypothetical protein
MTREEKIKMYQEKKDFIDRISEAFQNTKGSTVESVSYEVYENQEHGWYEEFVIITFFGGAISPFSANGNSNLANFQQIATRCLGGYYNEVDFYEKTKTTMTQIELPGKYADYLVFVGPDANNLEPIIAEYTMAKATQIAINMSSHFKHVEVSYMPCDDVDTNEVKMVFVDGKLKKK